MAGMSRWTGCFNRGSCLRNIGLVLSLLYCLLLNGLFVFGDDYESQIEKMRPVWKQYLHTLQRIQCDIEVSEYEGNTMTSRATVLFDVDFPCVRTQGTSGKRVESYNDKYSFILKRTDADDEWTLAKFEKNDKRPSLDSWDFLPVTINISQAQNLYNMIAGYTTMGLRLFPIWFPSLTMSDDFQVLSMERKTEDGLNVIVIKYRFEPNTKTLENSIRSGQVTLLEDHHYLIKNAEFEYICGVNPEKRGVAIVNNSYDFDSIFSVPVITEQETRFIEDGQEDKKIITYSNYKIPENTGKDRFMFSYYGIPELDFEKRPIGWVRILLMAVSVLLIVFVLCRMYSKHRESKA